MSLKITESSSVCEDYRDKGSRVSEFVNGKIRWIVNFLNRDRSGADFLKQEGITMAIFFEKIVNVFERLKIQKNGGDYSILMAPHFQIASKGAAVQKIAKTFESMGMGTCIEMGAVGYNYCKENGIPGELFVATPFNHAFLVIGRDRKSHPEDYRNWGKEAVVCDPWANKVYPASEIPKELKLYSVSKRLEDGSVEAVFEPFSYRCKFELVAQ